MSVCSEKNIILFSFYLGFNDNEKILNCASYNDICNCALNVSQKLNLNNNNCKNKKVRKYLKSSKYQFLFSK